MRHKTIFSILGLLFLIICAQALLLPYASFSTLYDLAFKDEPISTYNENYIRQQKWFEEALFWRLNFKKDKGTLQKVNPIVYMSTNYKISEKMWKLSNVGVKLYPQDKNWQSQYLISKLATQHSLNSTEQTQLTELINSLPNTRYDINIVICGEKNFIGTAFLEPYRDKLTQGEGRRYVCRFVG